MHFASNFGCEIIFMHSVNSCHQQDSKSLFKGSIGHMTSSCRWPIGPGGGLLPYMGYIGMCGPKGQGFSAVLVINRVSIWPFWS